MLPVDPNTHDPFYRYKMPPLSTTRESSKTVLSNLDAIARAIHREPAHLLKFLGMSLGCTQSHGQERPRGPGRPATKEPANKYQLNGPFESKRLQSLLYEYIEIFVLCRECGSPETRFVLDGHSGARQEPLKRLCSSCGAAVPQESHRLNSTIIRDVERGLATNEDTSYDKPVEL